jgi:nitric oxide reductase NorQ protein
MTATVYAPAPNQDQEFDELDERIAKTLDEIGNPEGISPEVRREKLAEALTKVGGKTLKGAPAGPPLDGDEPSISVPIEETDLVIPTKQAEPHWYEDPTDAKVFDHFILTRRALGTAFHGGLLITGGAGYGKTMGVRHGIRRLNETQQLNLRLTVMNCAIVTDPQKWFGRREVVNGETVYVKSDLVEAVERGDVILLDDLSRIHPNIANSIFSWLDGQQVVHLSDLNEDINVNPQTVFIATMNQGSQYGGTFRLDWAWRERFPTTIEKGPPPRDEEILILTSTTGVDPDGAAVLVDVARRSRQMYETGDLRTPISTRPLVAAAWWVASGMTEADALRYTCIPLFDADSNGVVGAESDRQKVAGILSMKTGR